MAAPAFGLGWHLWRRYRFFGLAFLTYGVVVALMVPWAVRGHFQAVALAGSIGLVMANFITIALFANPDADIVGRNSGYPPYLLTLPVRTRELVLWPMLYCIVTVELSWAAIGLLILKPLGVQLPLWWPALILAALAACILAVYWLPLGLPYLRLGLLILVIGLVCGLGIWGAYTLAPGALVSIFLGVVALAYTVAVSGVASARQGVTPDWTVRKERVGTAARPQKPFASPHQAQFWYEWRRNGILLPLVVGGILLVVYLCLLNSHDRAPLDIFHPLVPSEVEVKGVGGIQVSIGTKLRAIICLGLTPILSMALGCGVWRPDNRKPDHSLNPFYAARPLSSTALVFAKFKMAACSTLATWGIVLMFEALLLSQSAQDGPRVAPLGLLLLRYVTLKSGLLIVLSLMAALVLTWKSQVNGLFVDLAGRLWIANTYATLMPGLKTGFFVLLTWINTQHPEAWPHLFNALPYVIACAALLKLLVGGWALNLCRKRHLITVQTLVQISIGWSLVTLVSWASLCGLFHSELRSACELLCGIVLFLPLTRAALAVVALDWNRHR